MSFEQELINLNPERLERAVGAIEDEVKRGRNPATLMTPEFEKKYKTADYLIDILRDTLHIEAEHGQIDGETAHTMVVGAQLAMLVLMEYAEAESFEQKFPQDR